MKILLLLLLCVSLCADDIVIPSIATPTVLIPQASAQTVDVLLIDTLSFLSSITIIDVNSNKTLTPNIEVVLLVLFAKLFKTYFKDTRSILYDSNLKNSLIRSRWLTIYKNYKLTEYTLVKLLKQLRIIALTTAYTTPGLLGALKENLTKYKALGYNAVLLTFDTTLQLSDLLNTISVIKLYSMDVVICYAPVLDMKQSVYRDPMIIASYIKALANKSVAILLGWRRTSAHMVIQDKPFTDLLISSARFTNPSIVVIGESYMGLTTFTQHGQMVVVNNIPSCCGAVAVEFLGYYGINIEGALQNYYTKAILKGVVGVVIGPKPYFYTRKYSYTQEQIDVIKQKLEDRFFKAGAIATITMHGDGSNGIIKATITDNLTKTIYK